MVVILACICASVLSVASSAPFSEDGNPESGHANVDSSHVDYMHGLLNNNVYAVPPCAAAKFAAAANAANQPVARSAETAYNNLIPAEARYYVPNEYAGNMYRVDDPFRDVREMLRFSDTNFMEQVPAARFTYRTAPASYLPVNTANIASLNNQYNAPVDAASAYGVFPNANVGTCSIPLLFSCAPSVVRGQMVKPETQGYDSPSIAPGGASHSGGYRDVDDHYAQRMHANQEQAMYDNVVPVNKGSARSSEVFT